MYINNVFLKILFLTVPDKLEYDRVKGFESSILVANADLDKSRVNLLVSKFLETTETWNSITEKYNIGIQSVKIIKHNAYVSLILEEKPTHFLKNESIYNDIFKHKLVIDETRKPESLIDIMDRGFVNFANLFLPLQSFSEASIISCYIRPDNNGGYIYKHLPTPTLHYNFISLELKNGIDLDLGNQAHVVKYIKNFHADKFDFSININSFLWDFNMINRIYEKFTPKSRYANLVLISRSVYYDFEKDEIDITVLPYYSANKNETSPAIEERKKINYNYGTLIDRKLSMGRNTEIKIIENWINKGKINPETGEIIKQHKSSLAPNVAKLFWNNGLEKYDFSLTNMAKYTIPGGNNPILVPIILNISKLLLLPINVFTNDTFDTMFERTDKKIDSYDEIRQGADKLLNEVKNEIFTNVFYAMEEWIDKDFKAEYVAIGLLPEERCDSELLDSFKNPKFGPSLKNSLDSEIIPFGAVYHMYEPFYNILLTDYFAVKCKYSTQEAALSMLSSIKKQSNFVDNRLEIHSGLMSKFSFISGQKDKKKNITQWLNVVDGLFKIFDEIKIRNTGYYEISTLHKGFCNKIFMDIGYRISDNINMFALFSYIQKPAQFSALEVATTYEKLTDEKITTLYKPCELFDVKMLGEAVAGIKYKKNIRINPDIFLTEKDDSENVFNIKNRMFWFVNIFNTLDTKQGFEFRAFVYRTLNRTLSLITTTEHVSTVFDANIFVSYLEQLVRLGIRMQIRDEQQWNSFMFCAWQGDIMLTIDLATGDINWTVDSLLKFLGKEIAKGQDKFLVSHILNTTSSNMADLIV